MQLRPCGAKNGRQYKSMISGESSLTLFLPTSIYVLKGTICEDWQLNSFSNENFSAWTKSAWHLNLVKEEGVKN